MIETIRKHSKWLLWVIAGATIASLVLYMGVGPARNGGGGETVNTNLIGGKIYGQTVTPDLYYKMAHEFDLFCLFNEGEWPEQNPNITQTALLQQIYARMMEVQKAENLGIHVSDDQVKDAAVNMLRSPELLRALGVRAQSVPLTAFVSQVLAREGLTEDDFFNYIRDELRIAQLRMIYGLPGSLVTPLEATNEYIRENQEYSTEAVFFSASNYLGQTSVTPDEVGEFYTNFMADYRLPDRVQVSYVLFSVTNYLTQATRQLTNLDAIVENDFAQLGMQGVPDAKTPEEAKADIRKVVIRQQALKDAASQANDFAQAVYNVPTANKPASPQDLFTVARQRDLTVQTTAPFSADYGPQEFVAPQDFTRIAFELAQTPEDPISEPIVGTDGAYVMALDKFLPTEIPPLSQIHGQVTDDLRLREALSLAQSAGTNFIRKLTLEMAAGKSFAAASIAAGAEPQALPSFALSTQELPELDGHATLNQIKTAAITTPVGMTSGFKETDDGGSIHPEDGGFVLYVESKLPIDESKMDTDMPDFTAELRQQQANEAYNDWLNREANSQLSDTPLARAMGMR